MCDRKKNVYILIKIPYKNKIVMLPIQKKMEQREKG